MSEDSRQQRGDGRGKPDRRSGSDRRSSSDRRTGADRGGADRRNARSGGNQTARGRPERAGGSAGRRSDGPAIPPEITGEELSREVRAELVGVSKAAADQIARHLAAAGQLVDDDPGLAMEHAWAARARGARLAVVREACGVAAYAAGEFERALAELRAARRIGGSAETSALMADCERALGRPQHALELGQGVREGDMSRRAWIELQIVLAGARRDTGQVEAAVRMLELPELRSATDDEMAARLRYAYADALAAAGRLEKAHEWFGLAELVDTEVETDAGERRMELEVRLRAEQGRG